MSLENGAIAVELTQDRGADRKHEPGRIVVSRGQCMVEKPAVDAAVPVHKGVDVDEAKGHGGRSNDGIKATIQGPFSLSDKTRQQAFDVFMAGADVIGQRIPGLAIMDADEAALGSQAEPDKAGILADDDALKAFELGDRERVRPCLRDCLPPAGRACSGGAFALDGEG